MCRRLILACVRCRNRSAKIDMCKEFDETKYSSAFSDGWLYRHAKEKKYNVRNSIKIMFCDRCAMKNEYKTQPACDIHYRTSIAALVGEIASCYIGTVDVRNRLGIGIVFLD